MNLFVVLLAAALSIVHPVLSGNEFNDDSDLYSASNATFPSASNTTCPSHYKLSDGKLTVNGKFVFSESKFDKIHQLTEVPHDYVKLEIHDLPLSMQDITQVNELFHDKLTSVMLERVTINDSTGYFDFSKCNELKRLHIIQSTVGNQLQNSLKSVPSKLNDVDFTGNKVSKEVIELLKEHEISELDLTACRLESFPVELMKGLERLNLSENLIGKNFVDMVKDYQGEFAITHLNLSGAWLLDSSIKDLLDDATKFPKLLFLNVASNYIFLDSLKGILNVFSSLKRLQLSHDNSCKKMSDFLQILNEKSSSVAFPVQSSSKSSAQSVQIYFENKDDSKPSIDFISQLDIIANPCIRSWRNENHALCFLSFDTEKTSFDTVIEITFDLEMFSTEDIEKLSALTFPKLAKVRFNYYSEKDSPVLHSLLKNSPITDLHLYIKLDNDLTQLVSALEIKYLQVLTISSESNCDEESVRKFFTMFFDEIRNGGQKYPLKSLHINVDIGNNMDALLETLTFFPELESLEVTSKNLNEFSTTQSFPNLERLSIGCPYQMTEQSYFSEFIALFPNLLYLKFDPSSNSRVLREICESCKQLQAISLERYYTTENDDALLSLSKLPMIKDIEIVEAHYRSGPFIWDDSIKGKFNYLMSFCNGHDYEAIEKLKIELKKRNVTTFYQNKVFEPLLGCR